MHPRGRQRLLAVGGHNSPQGQHQRLHGAPRDRPPEDDGHVLVHRGGGRAGDELLHGRHRRSRVHHPGRSVTPNNLSGSVTRSTREPLWNRRSVPVGGRRAVAKNGPTFVRILASVSSTRGSRSNPRPLSCLEPRFLDHAEYVPSLRHGAELGQVMHVRCEVCKTVGSAVALAPWSLIMANVRPSYS